MGAKPSTQSAFGQSLAKEEKERKASTDVVEREKWQEEMKDFESKKSSSQGCLFKVFDLNFSNVKSIAFFPGKCGYIIVATEDSIH